MEEDEQYIKSLKEYLISAEAKAKYSIERFDILIITLSSAGLALSSSFLDKFENINKSHVYYACLFFAIALITNLLSQVTGYYANRNDIKCTNEEVKMLSNKTYIENYTKFDSYKKIFDFFTTSFNGASLTSFIVGIIFILIFIRNL